MRPGRGLRRRTAMPRAARVRFVDAVGEGVADDLLCAKVFHNSAVEPALAGGDIGNIADPCGVWLVKGEAARKEIGRDGVRVS